MKRIKYILLSLFLFLSLFSEAAELNKTDNVIFTAMENELGRAMKMLKVEKDKPYYISYFIDEAKLYYIGATLGCLFDEKDLFNRDGAAIVKVGNYKYDNSIYKRKRQNYDWELTSRATTDIPIGNNIKAIRHKLWLLTDSVFKKAINEYTVKKETEELEVKKKDKLLDYTKGKAVEYYEDHKGIKLDREKWKSIIKKLSLEFKKCPFLERSSIELSLASGTRYIINSEGAKVKKCEDRATITISGSMISNNNIPIGSSCKSYALTEKELPDEKELMKKVQEIIEEIKEQYKAQLLESYIGPVIFEAPAAAQFFANIFGGKILANRGAYENDSLIFINRVNRKIINRDITVYADSTVKYYDKKPLLNFHLYDDECVKTERVNIVEKGIFKNYLTSRTPIKGFKRSNGYANLEKGWSTYMKVLPGNLFVKTENPVHYEKLKEEMLKICKEYKMDYGIIIGGFKSSYISNSPMVRLTPISVVKIDVKTGKETSINGFNIPSTSILRILDKIIKIGDDPAVYNSYNASCVSPSILIEELELKENKNLFEKPPIIK